MVGDHSKDEELVAAWDTGTDGQMMDTSCPAVTSVFIPKGRQCATVLQVERERQGSVAHEIFLSLPFYL